MDLNVTQDSSTNHFLLLLLQINNFIPAYINPFVIIFGIIGNIIIIIKFPKKSVKMNQNARIYSIVIAIGDLGSLLCLLVSEFLSKGLAYLTNEKFYWHYYTLISCKIIGATYFSCYCTGLFSIEAR